MKMYGLFLMTYDYYEWEDLDCVSKDKDSLIKRAEPATTLDMTLEENLEVYRKYILNEREHYQIRELEVI